MDVPVAAGGMALWIPEAGRAAGPFREDTSDRSEEGGRGLTGGKSGRDSLKPVVTRWGLLVLGLIAGVAASLAFSAIDPGGAADLVAAREKGIVSVSILSGYPKSRDFYAFVATFLFCSAFPLAALRLFGRLRGKEGIAVPPSPGGTPCDKGRSWKVCLAVVGCATLLSSYHAGILHRAGWNPFVGAWVFLGEEGENLAWAQSVLSGDVYGRDFLCLYGPLMVYPLAGFLSLFGKSVLVARHYKLVLDLAGYGIILYFLYRAGRFRAAFAGFAVLLFLFFPPLFFPSPNFTYLRFAAALAPFLLFLTYREEGRPWRLFLSGALTTAIALTSQEAGLACLFALGGALLLGSILRREPETAIREGILFAGGLLAAALPFLAYFLFTGALPGVYESLIEFSRYGMLGYGGIPAPSLRGFLGNPLGEGSLYYLTLFLYAFTAVHVGSALLDGRRDRETWLRFLLLAYGVALFLVAVRRFSEESVIKVFLPAFLLWTRFLEGSVSAFLAARGRERGIRAVGLLGVLLPFAVASCASPLVRSHAFPVPDLMRGEKFAYRGDGLAVHPFERSGVALDRRTADSVIAISSFLERSSRGRDDVYFFPNEPVFYFLFDRVPPTRYVMSYIAATREQRLQIVRDLERKRTPFVVYSLATWRVDGIPEETQVPEVLAYILGNYAEVYRKGDVMILARKR